MFDETNKYKTNDHFFYMPGSSLPEVSKAVPALPGVYYIIRLARGHVDLVFIGKSGAGAQLGNLKETISRGLISGISTKASQSFIHRKMIAEKIDGLDIYWFVTIDGKNNDLPEYAEALLKQRVYNTYGRLPPWNAEV